MQDILNKIYRKAGLDLVRLLAEELTGSELNSLLLEVFDRKVSNLDASELLKLYKLNRFVKPADVDVIRIRQKELDSLRLLEASGFESLELSPVSLLGVSSVLGTVSQKKIMSAIRGTEVLSDATNAMAIHIAFLRKSGNIKDGVVKYCTTQRHVRTPEIKVKGFTPHFKIACMVSSGKDTGNFAFEKDALLDHFHALQNLLRDVFYVEIKYFKLQMRGGYSASERLIQSVYSEISKSQNVRVDLESPGNNYYKGIQYKAVIEIGGQEIEIADGGFVTWTQQLLENKKERMLISGIGIEYLTNLLK